MGDRLLGSAPTPLSFPLFLISRGGGGKKLPSFTFTAAAAVIHIICMQKDAVMLSPSLSADPAAPPQHSTQDHERCIVHFDIDCFYAQARVTTEQDPFVEEQTYHTAPE